MNSECRRGTTLRVVGSNTAHARTSRNLLGQVGQAMLLAALAFLAVTAEGAPAVTQIAAGSYHSLFLKSDGSVWSFGYNLDGELGLGSSPGYTNLPQKVVSSNVTAVAAGNYHSLLRKSDGSLWMMGYNGSGQLGDGAYTNHYFPN